MKGGGGELPSSKTTVYGDSGATETIKYEGGKPATKDVSRGTVQQHYSTDENGEFRLDSETKQIGPEMEEKSTHTYINNNEIIETTLPGDKTRTQVKTDGKLMSETNTQTGRSETVTYDESGKTTSKTILKGSNFENPDTKNQITYNKDGSRTESFEQPAKGIQITDHYNNKGFKTKETAVVNGKTYTATYDGKGHGTLTMKAGETVESFAQRTGCPVSEINRLNQFPGGVPQAGQQIKVPEKYVKATDSNNFAVNKNAERAKGNAAEEQRVENTMGKLSNVYEQKNTKGKYQSYDDYTSRLIQNEVKNGTLPESALNDKNLHKELSQKIKNLNGGANIKSLDSIKCPVSSSYNTKLKNVEKQHEQKKTSNGYDEIVQQGQKGYISGKYPANRYGTSTALKDTVLESYTTPTQADKKGVVYNGSRACFTYTDTKGMTWESETNSPKTRWRVAGTEKSVAKIDAETKKLANGDPNGNFAQRLKYKFNQNTTLYNTPAAFVAESTGTNGSKAYATIIGGVEALVETTIEEVTDT